MATMKNLKICLSLNWRDNGVGEKSFFPRYSILRILGSERKRVCNFVSDLSVFHVLVDVTKGLRL